MSRYSVFVAATIITLATNASNLSAQPFGPADSVAAKNIFLISAAALKCDNFTPVFSKISEYAHRTGVDESAFKDPDGKYNNQKKYAIQIVNSHIQVAGNEALCESILLDFGPDGKLARDLEQIPVDFTHSLHA